MAEAEFLLDAKIRHLDPPAPVTMERGSPLSQVIAKMKSERLRCMLITEKGRLVGIFTERDLLTRTLVPPADLSAPIDRYMTENPSRLRPDSTVGEAVRLMVDAWHRNLPIVDEEDRPRGLLTARRIMGYVVDHFPQAVLNVPSDPRKTPVGAEARHGA